MLCHPIGYVRGAVLRTILSGPIVGEIEDQGLYAVSPEGRFEKVEERRVVELVPKPTIAPPPQPVPYAPVQMLEDVLMQIQRGEFNPAHLIIIGMHEQADGGLNPNEWRSSVGRQPMSWLEEIGLLYFYLHRNIERLEGRAREDHRGPDGSTV